MGKLFSKELSAEDMANADLVLPKNLEIRDARELFKIKFPFYRMDIEAFEQKLKEINHIPDPRFKVKSAFTEVITVDQIREEFGEIAIFRDNWDRIEKLLKHPCFRELLTEDEATCSQMSQFKFETYVTKIDFGVLGFLWCAGSP